MKVIFSRETGEVCPRDPASSLAQKRLAPTDNWLRQIQLSLPQSLSQQFLERGTHTVHPIPTPPPSKTWYKHIPSHSINSLRSFLHSLAAFPPTSLSECFVTRWCFNQWRWIEMKPEAASTQASRQGLVAFRMRNLFTVLKSKHVHSICDVKASQNGTPLTIYEVLSPSFSPISELGN